MLAARWGCFGYSCALSKCCCCLSVGTKPWLLSEGWCHQAAEKQLITQRAGEALKNFGKLEHEIGDSFLGCMLWRVIRKKKFKIAVNFPWFFLLFPPRPFSDVLWCLPALAVFPHFFPTAGSVLAWFSARFAIRNPNKLHYTRHSNRLKTEPTVPMKLERQCFKEVLAWCSTPDFSWGTPRFPPPCVRFNPTSICKLALCTYLRSLGFSGPLVRKMNLSPASVSGQFNALPARSASDKVPGRLALRIG